LRLETRPDGGLVLTRTGGGRWGTAVAAFAAGGIVLASVVSGETTILAAVIAVPLGVIAVLAGLAAARHRDWIVFDRRARQILSRQGLAALFRAVRSVPFAEVEAIVVGEPAAAEDRAVVGLRREGGALWLLDATDDPDYRERLVAALRDVGGWPVEREREPARP
jgi:2,3-bisphosphoglycerate-independent phosphoglycerate mutase